MPLVFVVNYPVAYRGCQLIGVKVKRSRILDPGPALVALIWFRQRFPAIGAVFQMLTLDSIMLTVDRFANMQPGSQGR